MKKIVFVFICFYGLSSVIAQTSPTAAQKKFSDDIFNFLKEEGYVPSVTEKNSIDFKNEGDSYRISISSESPFFTVFSKAGYKLEGDEGLNRNAALLACNEVNKIKNAVKFYCTDNGVSINIEQYTRSSEDFKYVFYKNLEILKESEAFFIEKYKNLPSDASAVGMNSDVTNKVPFLVKDVQISNVYEDGTIETEYGSPIYDFSTMYIKPRLTVTPLKTGTMTIYVKLYAPTGLSTASSSAATDYSFSSNITIADLNEKKIDLSGWGGKDKGHWKEGQYRFEFWYGDVCLGTKSFTIY